MKKCAGKSAVFLMKWRNLAVRRFAARYRNIWRVELYSVLCYDLTSADFHLECV